MTGEIVLPLAPRPPVEDHAVTRRVDKFDKLGFDKIPERVDEDGATVPVEKIDLGPSEPKQGAVRAQGTPRPGGLPSVLLDQKTPFVPDATLALAKEAKRPEDEYYDEVMFVAPGMTGRISQRKLPVIAGGDYGNKNDRTMPLFKFSKLDDPQH